MLKFKTSCAVLAYLSSNLLNEIGLSPFRYFEVGLRVCDIVVKKFTFAISSPDEFLFTCKHLSFRLSPEPCRPTIEAKTVLCSFNTIQPPCGCCCPDATYCLRVTSSNHRFMLLTVQLKKLLRSSVNANLQAD